MVFNFTGQAGFTPVPSAGATGQAGLLGFLFIQFPDETE